MPLNKLRLAALPSFKCVRRGDKAFTLFCFITSAVDAERRQLVSPLYAYRRGLKANRERAYRGQAPGSQPANGSPKRARCSASTPVGWFIVTSSRR